VISDLANSLPEMIVGAGTVLDVEMAQRCVDPAQNSLSCGIRDERIHELARRFLARIKEARGRMAVAR